MYAFMTSEFRLIILSSFKLQNNNEKKKINDII